MSSTGQRPWVPWRGENFGRASRFGVGLLVVGESHYTNECHQQRQNDPSFTCGVVQRWAIEEPTRYFLQMGRILNRKRNAKCTTVWHDVAFCNFVTRLLANGERPRQEDWANGLGPFRQTLDELRPDAVLVTGLGPWNHALRDCWGQHICTAPAELPVFGVHRHPRGRVSYVVAFPIVDGLLHKARRFVE